METQGDHNDRGSIPQSSPMPFIQRHPGLLSNTPHRGYSDAMVEQQQLVQQQQSGNLPHSHVNASTSQNLYSHRAPAPFTLQYVTPHSSNYSSDRPYRPQAYRAPEPSVVQESSQHLKKFRTHQPKLEHQQPLEICVKEPTPAYAPQVEAISPTPIAVTKEDLLHKIHKVDRDIAAVQQRLAQLKKKEIILETGDQHPEEAEKPTTRLKHHSLAQKIYAENRKMAKEAHIELDALGPSTTKAPLYNQPSDSSVYHENQRCFILLKPKLVSYLRKKAIERHNYQQKITKTYGELMNKWLKMVEKHENGLKKTQVKSREIFEKIFPEIRKHREDKERLNRVGNRVKSDADLEEIMDGIKEQEMEDKKMRSLAVVPPMLLDPDSRRHKLINNNGRIYDLAPEHKEWTIFNIWTPEESELFKEKYLQNAKHFGTIASFFEKKSVADCVQHYYLTKKQENYRHLLPKTRQGRARGNRNNPGITRVATSSADLSSGVTTRLQREHMQRQQESTPRGSGLAASSASVVASEAPPVTSIPETNIDENISVVEAAPLEDAPALESMPMETSAILGPSVISLSAIQSTEENMDVDPPNERIQCNRRDMPEDIETSDEESGGLQISGPHVCVVCRDTVDSPAHSRHLPRNHGKQYGLSEEEILPGSRVCNTCRCKAVRSRCMVCPLPSCPNAKGIVKRMRSIPSKWTNLPPEVLDPVCQIPSGATKCCSACYNRISRRLAPFLAPESNALRWTDSEIESLRATLKQFGTQWSKTAEGVRSRSQQECKNFFVKCRKKYNLDAVVREYYINNFGEDRKPVVTDEEESGSSTSSCEELPADAADSSDTASAGSPPKQSETSGPPSGKESTSSLTIVRTQNDRTLETGARTEGHIPPHLSTNTVNGALPMSPPSAVKDLMANVIEKQLMKSPSGLTIACSGPPTITSILSTDTSFKRIVGDTLATLTIASVQAPSQPSSGRAPEMAKVPIVVQTVQPHQAVRERESEPETLDLSIKGRNTPERPPATTSSAYYTYAQPVHPSKGGVIIYQREQPYYHPPTSKAQNLATPHLVMQPSRTAPSSSVPSTGMPRLSPSVPPPVSSSKPGSITHGTPVQAPSRFTPMIRQLSTPQHREGGSITQGTPVHHLLPPADKRQNLDMKRSSPSVSGAAYATPYPPSHMSTSYPLERQQLSSRQILNDYITSQQMHRVAAVPANEKRDSRSMPPHLPYSTAPQTGMYLHRTETTTSSPMRHSTMLSSQEQSRNPSGIIGGKYAGYPPPGHEAFSSLVEAAVKQPLLPVPANDKKHFSPREAYQEGLGKTMSDSFSSSRVMEHPRTSTSMTSDHQQLIRRNQEREREMMMSQRSQEQCYQRDTSRQHYQYQMHRQLQAQMEHQRQQEQNRIDHVRAEHQRMEVARLDQANLAKQQRMPQPLSSYMESQQRREKERDQREREWERDRDRGQGRIVMPGSYHRDRQHSPAPVPPSPPSALVAAIPSSNQEGVSAATLIDAIITHQINQSSETGPAGARAAGSSQQTRPGDRLFQDFLREGPRQLGEPNGKRSPMKRTGSPLEREPTKIKTMIDHIDSVISNDYNLSGYQHSLHRPHGSMVEQAHRPGSSHSDNSSDRVKVEERQIIQMAQLQAGVKQIQGPPRQQARYHSEKPSDLSPLDYVKSRIVEVMRTSDDKDRDEGGAEADEQCSGDTHQHQPSTSEAQEAPSVLPTLYEPLSDNDD